MPLVCPPERVLLQNLDGKSGMVKLSEWLLSQVLGMAISSLDSEKNLFTTPLHIPGTA
jgi:hypothetical protein